VDIWHCDAQGNIRVSTRSDTTGKTSCADINVQMQMALFNSRRSSRAGTRAGLSTSTLRSVPGATAMIINSLRSYFDDTLTDRPCAEPYANGQRDTRNSNDNIFSGGGDRLLLNLQGHDMAIPLMSIGWI
jgi:hypothetical protein